MNKIWDEFIQRNENKSSRGDARVWKLQKLGIRSLLFKYQQIEVDRARTERHVSCSSQRIFNAQQPRERLFRRRQGRAAQLRHEVQKRRLLFILDGLGFVNARESNNIQTSVEHSAHSEQKVAGAIAEIGAESDVSVLDHLSDVPTSHLN